MLEFAKTPPKGWNSWDVYGASVTEEEVKRNADIMAEKLKKYGWNYVVVDIQWYEPGAESAAYRKFADLKIDEYEDSKIIKNLLNVLYDIYIQERSVNNLGTLSIKKSILSILGEEANLNIDNIDFLEQMSNYIIKIRKYAINKKTYNLNSDPRNLIKYNEGDIVSDAILNKIQINSKELQDNILHMKVKSKSGEYNFKFRRA